LDVQLPVYQAVIQGCSYGDPAAEEVVWRDNNPTPLAGNLRGVRLFLRSGDGSPGPYDSPTRGQDVVEWAVGQMAQRFLAALHKAGVRGVDSKLGKGTHTWPYWQQDLRQYLAWLRRQLRHPVTAPPGFSVASAHTEFTVWGWTFEAHRSVREFTYLRGTSDSLTVTGSGTLHAVTPQRYRGGSRYAVRIGGTTRSVTADRQGRLSFDISLGPSHIKQQTEFGPGATSGWHRVRVLIRSWG
jgi:hypothetical protein